MISNMVLNFINTIFWFYIYIYIYMPDWVYICHFMGKESKIFCLFFSHYDHAYGNLKFTF